MSFTGPPLFAESNMALSDLMHVGCLCCGSLLHFHVYSKFVKVCFGPGPLYDTNNSHIRYGLFAEGAMRYINFTAKPSSSV